MLKKTAKWVVNLLPQSTYLNIRNRYRGLRNIRSLRKAIIQDSLRFRSYSGLVHATKKSALQAHIIKSYHRVEKALSLPNPRPGFGEHAVHLLLEELNQYLASFATDFCVAGALNTLDEYVLFNESHQIDMQKIKMQISALRLRSDALNDQLHGGTKMISAAQIYACIPDRMFDFFNSRYSVRQFDTRIVDLALIEQAVVAAQKTPSVCNRESGHTFIVSERAQIDRLLAFQNGNRGFGDQVDKLLIVTSRLPCFHTVGERYQHWIDGGMYAMSLVYALHALGLGSCCLNWSVEPKEDRAFKIAAGISDEFTVLMFIAVGHLPAEPFKVAQSPRRPSNEVMTYL